MSETAVAESETQEQAPQLSERGQQALTRLEDVSKQIKEADTTLRREREDLIKTLVDEGVADKTVRDATGLSYMAFVRVRKIATGEQAAPAQTQGDAEAAG